MAARKVVARKVTKVVAQRKKSAPPAPKTVEVKVELTIWVDSGADDPRSIEELREDVKKALTDPNGLVRAKRVTNTGGYYLVNGKVCLPDDYDPETRGFKPGAHPPMWAMSADERAIQSRIEKEKSLPALARNPQGLRTTKETDEFHKQESRSRTPKEALDDLYENSEWGKKKKAEAAERERLAKEAAESASDDEDEFTDDELEIAEEDDEEEEPYFDEDEEGDSEDDDEVSDDEFEWDEDNVMDEDMAEEAVEEQTSSALAKLRKKTPSKPEAVKKTVRKVVRRK
ncbi:hypothetical protein [Streptomyces sp. NPDC006477]|uniref:hypothetical protein n=1 Tax=Streptomyces sp. NPDC006477 TaxID=3364747 RepID=UPI0036B4E455